MFRAVIRGIWGGDPTEMRQPQYTIRRVTVRPELEGRWHGPAWSWADTLDVAWFHPRSSDHRPRVQARVLYDDEALYVAFRVDDRYVRAVHTEYNGPVCLDSCVECFVRPRPDLGYFNFETNCGGTLHLSYVEDPTRTPDGFKKRTFVPEGQGGAVRIYHSLPRRVEPERVEETVWTIEYAVPWGVFEAYVGPLGDLAGQEWRGNFYKCGDETSHPHWAAWAPLGEELNFHQPRYFAPLRFQ